MKTTRTQNLIASAFVGAPTLTNAYAQQFPIPTTAAEPLAPTLCMSSRRKNKNHETYKTHRNLTS